MLQIEEPGNLETNAGCWYTPCCCGRSKGACWLINCLVFWVIAGAAVGLGLGLSGALEGRYYGSGYYSYDSSNSYSYNSPSSSSYKSPSSSSYDSPSYYSYDSSSSYSYVSPSSNSYVSSSTYYGFSVNGVQTKPCSGTITMYNG